MYQMASPFHSSNPDPSISLPDAVKASLEEKGVLGEIRARIRKEVVKTLRENEDPVPPQNKKSGDKILIRELIKEYLSWAGLEQTGEVLALEGGGAGRLLGRQELEARLGVECGGNAKELPLLFSIVSTVKKGGGTK